MVLKGQMGMTLSPNGRWLATAANDQTVRLVDPRADDPSRSTIVLSARELDDGAFALTFSPDGRWLLCTAGSGRTGLLWDLSGPRPKEKPIVLQSESPEIAYPVFSPNSRWLVCSSTVWETARAWDLAGDDPAVTSYTLRGHRNGVESVVFSPDSTRLVSYGVDRFGNVARFGRDVHVWNLLAESPFQAQTEILLQGGYRRRMLGRLHSPIDVNNRWLITGGSQEDTMLWNLRIDDLLKNVRRVAGRALTDEERDLYLIERDAAQP